MACTVPRASTSQLHQQQQQQYGKKRRKCFRYGNYHRYYGYRVGESLEDHRIPHFKEEWFQGKRQGGRNGKTGGGKERGGQNDVSVHSAWVQCAPHVSFQFSRVYFFLFVRRVALKNSRRASRVLLHQMAWRGKDGIRGAYTRVEQMQIQCSTKFIVQPNSTNDVEGGRKRTVLM